MAADRSEFVAKMDRLGVECLARSRGLPPELASRVSVAVVESGLPEDRRAEVFEELVAHFLDGLAAGRPAEALAADFGEAGHLARDLRHTKRTVTPPVLGGTGPRDGFARKLVRDAAYAFRRFKARPVFTAIAVGSLGIGIGANTAMFTLVNEVILRKPALERPEELVDLYAATKDSPFSVFSIPDYQDFSRATTAFSGLAGTKFSLVPFEVDGTIHRLAIELVSGNYFEVLGIRPRAGRLIAAADATAPGESPVVVLGEGLWRRVFASDPAVVGRTIRLNGSSFTVIGVAPIEYPGRLRGVTTDVYAPITLVNQIEGGVHDQLTDRNTQGTFLTGRLQSGATLARARVELEQVATDLRGRREGMWELGASLVLIPSNEVIIYPPLDRLLKPLGAMLLVVVALVLVIACANLASFLLARAIDRRKEIAVRLALGATRAQLVSQLLVETVLLALIGGALGLWLGRFALSALLASELPLPVPISLRLVIDGRVLAFSVAISVAAGVVFGLLPALQSTRLDLASIIRDEATGGGRRKWTVRNALVGGQVAISLILMVVAGLLIRSLEAVRRVDPGFGRQPAALAWIGVQNSGPSRDRAVVERVRQLAAAVPGIGRVGLAGNLHLNALGTQQLAVNVDGIEPPEGRPYFEIDRAAVDTGFFAAMGLTLRAGRLFTAMDEDSLPRVAVVNEAFANRFWPGQDAVGRRFRVTGGREVEIAGVVNTAKIRSLAEEPRPFVYLPMWVADGTVWLIGETTEDADRVANGLARAVATDDRLFVMQARSLRSHIEVMSLPLRMGATALIVFSALALLLACVGLYGAVGYAVAQRSREVGIRLSLGADRHSVVRLLLWGGLRIALVGIVVGLPLAIGAGRAFEGVLFGIRGLDPVTLVLVPALLVVVTTMATYLPARRAGRLSPVSVLRGD
ncbi:MAG: ABC transporter permease [Gemmatimonadales bacterium]